MHIFCCLFIWTLILRYYSFYLFFKTLRKQILEKKQFANIKFNFHFQRLLLPFFTVTKFAYFFKHPYDLVISMLAVHRLYKSTR